MHAIIRRKMPCLFAVLTVTIQVGGCQNPTESRKPPPKVEEVPTPQTPADQPPSQQPPYDPNQVPKQTTACPLPETLLLPVGSSISTREDPLKSLTTSHPRIYITPQRLASLKGLISSGDPMLAELMGALRAKGTEIEKRVPLVATSDSSREARLVSSPEAAERILTLAGIYLLTGDTKSARQAVDVMKAAASFPDWHPGHFLDTSVMAYAMGVGYDWTYDLLSEEERRTFRSAILEKGIKPAIKEYTSRNWWTKSADNWPLVIGGGIGIAALAIGDAEPQAAKEALTQILTNVENPLKNFEPEGAWPEGPMYWGYGSMYLYGLADAMQTALGTDLGLSQRKSLSESGYFRVHLVGSSKKPFSFYDTGEGVGSADFMMWMARQYQKPYYAQMEHRTAKLSGIRAVLWYAPGCFEVAGSPPPASHAYRRLNMAILRSSYDNQKSVYIGFKGGDNKTSHGHLDLGSFVLDADGERWAIDLGGDAYTVPGYFESRIRPTLYRISTQGHNTLTIAPGEQKPLEMPNQVMTATAPLRAFRGENDNTQTPTDPAQRQALPRIFAVADLTQGYQPHVTKALRGIGVRDDNSILIIDEIQGKDAAITVVPHFHTRAKIQVQGGTATLSLGPKLLRMKLLAPKDARFEVISANPRVHRPASQENSNPDVKDLIVRLSGPQQDSRIALWLIPGSVTTTKDPRLEGGIAPLADWIQAAPL